MPHPLAMVRDGAGLWAVTTPPMQPQIYDYQFDVDGRMELDPANVLVSPSLVSPSSLFTVPGTLPELWERRDVPNGVVHRHVYTSSIVRGLVRGQSEYFVYTPPGYNSRTAKRYPVLYLLHGWSDPATGWTAIGQADTIMDNLFAEGKIVPMVVMMPLSYGDMSFVQHGFEIWNDKNAVRSNVRIFSRVLLSEIVPRVEAEYAVRHDAPGRALAGLSMGGLESLMIGLNNPAQFAWIGGFSSAVKYLDLAQEYPQLEVSGVRLHGYPVGPMTVSCKPTASWCGGFPANTFQLRLWKRQGRTHGACGGPI